MHFHPGFCSLCTLSTFNKKSANNVLYILCLVLFCSFLQEQDIKKCNKTPYGFFVDLNKKCSFLLHTPHTEKDKLAVSHVYDAGIYVSLEKNDNNGCCVYKVDGDFNSKERKMALLDL